MNCFLIYIVLYLSLFNTSFLHILNGKTHDYYYNYYNNKITIELTVELLEKERMTRVLNGEMRLQEIHR